jgi:apolipoprotein N-acyltransferase
MVSKDQGRSWLLTGAAAVATVLFSYFGTGLHPVWWSTWLAPLPVLWLAGGASTRANALQVALASFLGWFLGSTNMWHYLHGLIGLPVYVLLLASALPSGIFLLSVLLWRKFLLHRQPWLAALSLPCLWVTIEYLYASSSPNSTFGNLAYTQMDFLPLIQIASVAGIWGVSFFLWLVPSTIGVLASGAIESSKKKHLGLTVGVVTAAVLLAGVIRLHTPAHTSGTVTVQLISSDAPDDIFAIHDKPALALVGRYAAAVPSAASQPRDVILLPEKIAKLSEAASDAAKAELAAAAKRAGAALIAGLDEVTPKGRRNEALLFSQEGALEESYEKHHFIPVIEDGYVLGTDYTVMTHPSGIWGIAICKDMDFPAMGRAYGRRGVGLLLVPAWDFTIDGWLHDRMAILRGVESGFTIVRNAKQGLQSVSDTRGRLLLGRRVYHDGFVVSTLKVPVEHVDTLYARWGDWFAWLCCIGFALLIGTLAIRRR